MLIIMELALYQQHILPVKILHIRSCVTLGKKPKVLHALADDKTIKPIQVTYINPETGDDCQNIIGYSALMLRPNETLQLQPRSTAQIFHVIDGQLQVKN